MRVVAFDLDDTLAPSKSRVPSDVAAALRRLLDAYEVCVISGGQLAQFETQLVAHLDATPAQLDRLHLMPTCGTQYYRYRDGQRWCVYRHDLDPEQRRQLIAALEREARRLNLWENETWGPIIEDRGSQVTYSALGQEAPLDAKRAWDPTGEKKQALAVAIRPQFPDLEVRGGGSTSVDITARGVDKAYGMARLCEALEVERDAVLFIGDRLDKDGNDYPVKAAGYSTIAVTGWWETAELINRALDGGV